MLGLLIELGADLEAQDAKGRTPLAVAMLRGDREAMRILHAAGAKASGPPERPRREQPSRLAASIDKISPMLGVPDIDATVAWYRSVGFQLAGSHAEHGKMDWASVTFGEAEIMFVRLSEPWRDGSSALSFWIRTSRLDYVYSQLKRLQVERARATLGGETTEMPEVRFIRDLDTAFYGQREFAIRDPNGIELCFYQPLE